MSIAATSPSVALSSTDAKTSSLRPFLVQEYLRIMRSRLAYLIWFAFFYTIAAIPVILERPQEDLLYAVTSWLGSDDIQNKMVLFLYIDASMNKIAMVLGPLLAGGIIVEERSRGSLDLFASKPVRAGDYFTVKLIATLGAFATFYIVGFFAVLVTFPYRVAGFDPLDFTALSTTHLFAALFAVTFSAWMAVTFKHKLTGMLVSFLVLSTLVGFTWLGFIYPEMREISNFNPFFQGIVLIGSLGHYGILEVVVPILILIVMHFVVALLGRWQAIKTLAKG